MKVCAAGTFNVIHDGHIALLTTAFAEGDELTLGLTADHMAAGRRSVPVRAFGERLRDLARTLEKLSGGKPFAIVRIDDELGPAATGDYDKIVVSADTEPGALRINRARQSHGLKPLMIVTIPMALARDGEPISSTRVLRGQITADGDMRS